MSHYSLLVILPPQADLASEDGQGLLAQALALYDENNEKAISPKWDWWAIGGRWGAYFPIAHAAPRGDVLVEGKPEAGRCDGGRIRALDLEKLRADAATKAEADWNEYAMVIADTPACAYWSTFYDRIEASEREILGKPWRDAVQDVYAAARAAHGAPTEDDAYWDWAEEQPEGFYDSAAYKAYDAATDAGVDALKAKLARSTHYDIERARLDYRSQPRVRVVQNHPSYKQRFLRDPVGEFDRWTRDEYVESQRRAAVPGFATLLVTSQDPDCRRFETQWIAKGEMGWFGMSSDTDDSTSYYMKKVNALIDDIDDPDTVLVVVDCHI